MDRRYAEVWRDIRQRKARGEPLPAILRGAGSEDLVAALAGGGTPEDAVAANAIATELLNRLGRAPFLGAFLVSGALAFALFVVDYVDTGHLFFTEGGFRAEALAVLFALLAGVALLGFRLWRGALPGLRMALRRFRRHRTF